MQQHTETMEKLLTEVQQQAETMEKLRTEVQQQPEAETMVKGQEVLERRMDDLQDQMQ